MLEAVLPSDPGEVYANSAYAADRFTNVIRARGGVARVVYTSTWGGPAALARLEAWRMRRLGLAKAGLQVRLTVIAYNLRRSATILRAREV